MVKVVITNYGFKKPPLITEEDFISYKQIFQVDDKYSLTPKRSFWDEFGLVKWGLVALVVGTLLALIWDPLAFIPAIAFILLFISMLTGTAQSMYNYHGFLNEKNSYYERLKQAIVSSKNYNEFKIKAIAL
jgi:hypothetical protein